MNIDKQGRFESHKVNEEIVTKPQVQDNFLGHKLKRKENSLQENNDLDLQTKNSQSEINKKT